ncbi:hypothetical protein MY10362_002977 [Beauveria mimosiformis]
MKFSLATIALAAAVVASPTNPPAGAGNCNVNGKTGNVTCCNPAINGQILCNVLARSTCISGQTAYCCDTSGQTGGLININALNCDKIL